MPSSVWSSWWFLQKLFFLTSLFDFLPSCLAQSARPFTSTKDFPFQKNICNINVIDLWMVAKHIKDVFLLLMIILSPFFLFIFPSFVLFFSGPQVCVPLASSCFIFMTHFKVERREAWRKFLSNLAMIYRFKSLHFLWFFLLSRF